MAKGDSTVDIGKASPPVGKAFAGGQKSGERGFGKESWSRPAEQSESGRAFKGGQGAGAKGFAKNESFKP